MKKKLMIIHHSGLLGGAGLSLESMLPILSEHFDLKVYVPEKPSSIVDRLILKNFDVESFKGRLAKITTYSGGNKFFGLRFIYHAIKIPIHYLIWLRIIMSEKPDVLLVNSRVLCWFALMPRPAKKICFIRETKDPNSEFCERNIVGPLLRRFDKCLFLSRFDRDQHNFNAKNSIISPDFIHDGHYSPHSRDSARKCLGVDSSKFVVCFVGGVDPLKGLSSLIRAVHYFRRENKEAAAKLEVIICGDISIGSLNKYKNAYDIDDFNLVQRFITDEDERNFIKLGIQSDLSIVYSASNCLIFPMTKPHQSRPAFEIGLFGGFPILPNFENVSEYYKDGVNAVIYEGNSHAAMAAKFEWMLNNLDACDTIGERNMIETRRIRSAQVCLGPLIDYIASQ